MALLAKRQLTTSANSYRGLSPFLRNSIAGRDLRSGATELLAKVSENPSDAESLMNTSLVMQCLEQRELGLAFQTEALSIQRIYRIEATDQPAQLRVLMLMIPGDIAANTPLECLLETSDIELILYYLSSDEIFHEPIPEHDIALVALGESDENRSVLDALETRLANWPVPIVNHPRNIPSTDRHRVSQLLQSAPGIAIPLTHHATRTELLAIVRSEANFANCFADCDYPMIIRPVGSQAGRDLEKISSSAELLNYLVRVAEDHFFIASFVDYRSNDGLFRKFRIAMIDSIPFACHMGVSSKWMIHYVNAGMYEEAWKRAEEARFMEAFSEFADRHREALQLIYERIGLDYFCIDCAEAKDGRFLVFELDNCMIVHAMDSEEMFPYKQHSMYKVKAAFENYLLRLHEANR